MNNAIDEMVTKRFLDYWGFETLPFPKVIDPIKTFMNKHHENALMRLTQLLHTREIAVVVGESGSGKSTLMDMFLGGLSSTRYKIIRIENPQNRPREMYRGIASAMGVNTTWFGADALKVVDLLTYSYLESSRPSLVMIDEAHIMAPSMLNELRLLTNTKVKNEPLITLMLFGQPSLASTLKLPAMVPLAQRIGAWITLKPMAEEESSNYIDWHIKNAGSENEIFLAETKKAVYRRAQGNARLINRLCLECLNQGCLDGVKTISEELFSYVCKNLGPHLAN
jgi:type II secretory pathway predicted ATPase ExeA